MVYKKNYLNIVICIALIIVLSIGGFLVYKELHKDNKPNEEKEEEKTTENISPLLYEVTKEGSTNKMYLFGSIHAALKKDLDSLPDYVINAYNNSHYLACEIDDSTANDPDVILKLTEIMIYDDETTIKDHITEETYNKMVEFLKEKKSYSTLLEMYKPAYFATLIEQLTAKDAGLDLNSSVDSFMLNKARKDQKTILEVESIEYQFNLLYNFSDVLYEQMINDLVDDYDDAVKELKDLYNSWKTGNAEEIISLSSEEFDVEEDFSEELKKAIEEYENGLIINRNSGMVDKAIEYFDNDKDVFFMVGAAHIVGEKGIANSLKEKGYTVTQVK